MSNKIEKIVRHYVNKVLFEVAGNLDELVEQKVKLQVERRLQLGDLLREHTQEPRSDLHEVFEGQSVKETTPTLTPMSTPKKRKLSAADLGISEDTWKSVYADTMQSDNPILTEEHIPQPGETPPPDRPELVSESAMEQFGFMRDFSKHVDAFDAMDKKKHHASKEDQEAQAAYKEALQKVVHNV